MKRVWISLGIFIVLTGVCILGTIYTNQISTRMIQTVTEAKSAELRGETETAVQLSRKAGDDWRSMHTVLCTYMPHSKLEAIDQTLAGLPMLCQYGGTEQFLADCDRSIEQISYLNESEIPSIANIF
ncbi:hypothetical protein CAFE_01030 [Caprobacter fermentans]|uniref:DUF4363 family protein n=1 Tax=Caproicibacter fermentans TaxID=2576756 RepID=A0A6N8HV00_9FIRM|nr:DUF4363 family protein [Caproicibacter fermentans]MVB09447.1 hypothetical protein [Caproicibacter fermentans]OCN02973.1 hypothetical protein A7X67_06080 [Clostridium sp. W14A]QNK41483.1 DUF4363 family protein [Caproicibacter fermentans]